MEVLKVNGWHQDDRFFEVQVTHETYLDDEDIRGIASIFNCKKSLVKYSHQTLVPTAYLSF